MANFGFEEPAIHGVHHILAVSTPTNLPGPYRAVSFIFVSDKGEHIQLDAICDKQASYVRDLALAINRVNDDYGFLSDDERQDLLPDTLLVAAE